MGRGRQKAKQTKVARGLKYRDQGTDFEKLAEELHGGSGTSVFDDGRPEPAGYDQWSDYSDPLERTDRSA